MLINRPDGELFYKLHRSLMVYVNQRLKVLQDEVAGPEEFGRLPPEARVKVRDAFLADKTLLERFVDENPQGLSEDELEIVRSWRHLVAGQFLVFRELKNYTVFLSTDKPPIAYGVLALAQPFEELIGPYLPVMVETVLLPFKDKIIYDSLMNTYSISFGGGIRRGLNEDFKNAKQRQGIVTALPMSATAMSGAASGAGSKPHLKEKPIAKSKPKAKSPFVGRWQIVSMSQWDEEYINEEVQAYIEFNAKGGGSFQFGYVRGQLDSRTITRGGEPRISFSWEGGDGADGTPLTGRGEATLQDDELVGTFFIHDGDDSDFVAKRVRNR